MSHAYPDLRRLPLATTVELPTPPDELLPETFAARLYGMLAPLAQHDDQAGFSLLILANAIGTMYQLVEDLVRDTPEGPGWSMLVDLDRCPDDALPWLAQFVGVRLLPGSNPSEQRARIASTDGFRRGTVAALVGAAASTLTGERHVVFRERDHDPSDTPDYAYYLTVRTYEAETPDPAATELALLAQKPGALVLDYGVAVGQSYDVVRLTYATYADVHAAFDSYGAILVDLPAATDGGPLA